MFNSQRYRTLLLHFKPQKSSLKLNFCTTTSQSESFRVSYLINNLGFPPETALKVAKRLRSRFLVIRPRVLCTTNLLESLEEVKGLGFDPSKTTFGVALIAMKTVTKTKWDEKVDTFKKWGWSRENVVGAFRKHPNIMLASNDKIDLIMRFWVNQMGWDSLALVNGPYVFAFNLQKRIIPRAEVLKFLLKKGLRKKDASLVVPFVMSEKEFLNKFVLCFEEESAYLLKLYEENMNLASPPR